MEALKEGGREGEREGGRTYLAVARELAGAVLEEPDGGSDHGVLVRHQELGLEGGEGGREGGREGGTGVREWGEEGREGGREGLTCCRFQERKLTVLICRARNSLKSARCLVAACVNK